MEPTSSLGITGTEDLWMGALGAPGKASCTPAPGYKGLGAPTVRKGSQHSGSCAKDGTRFGGRPRK